MRRAKLGDLIFNVVTKEEISDRAEVTDKPIEKGSDVSDHHKPLPTRIELSGAFTKEDAPKHLETLRKYYRQAELLTYTHRNIFTNVVIETLDTDHHRNNKHGFDFQATLKVIKLSESKEFEVKAVSPVTNKPSKKTNTQVKRTTTQGRQQAKPKKLSDTQRKPKTGGRVTQKASVVYRPDWKETVAPGNTVTSLLRSYNISELNRKKGKKYAAGQGGDMLYDK